MGNLQVNKTGENQSSVLGVYILSRGLHLYTLDLQISCAILHEEAMRSIAWISGSYPIGQRQVIKNQQGVSKEYMR